MLGVMTMTEKLLTVEQVAEIVQKHPNTVKKWIRSGELEASDLGRGYRIRQSALDDFIQRKQIKPKKEEDH